ncbi:hypothetical protein B0H19DRAFT_1263468 [Mycena capillaripes]|nr:hypothetical protein B0H19DRAFT_1263468 [Mycena capillaripes]
MSPACSFVVETAYAFQWHPGYFHRKTPNVYVKIYQDGVQLHRTSTMKRTLVPQWNDSFTFSSESPTAEISVKLFHDATVPLDPCLGAATIQLQILLNLCTANLDSKATSIPLLAVNGTSKGTPSGTVVLHVESLTSNHVKSAIEDAQTAVIASELGSSGLGEGGRSCVRFKDRVESTGAHRQGASQANPYANAAWKMLTSVYEAVNNQQETDDRVLQLLETMVEVYSFVGDVEFLLLKITISYLVDPCLRLTVAPLVGDLYTYSQLNS